MLDWQPFGFFFSVVNLGDGPGSLGSAVLEDGPGSDRENKNLIASLALSALEGHRYTRSLIMRTTEDD